VSFNGCMVACHEFYSISQAGPKSIHLMLDPEARAAHNTTVHGTVLQPRRLASGSNGLVSRENASFDEG